MIKQPLWPKEVKLDVIGVTGDYGSGKTLFCLGIRPEATLYYDFEKSGGTYVGAGVDRIDFPAHVMNVVGDGATQAQTFALWLEHLRSIAPGKYDVIAIDTISDIESGLAAFVGSKYAEHGYKSEAAFRKMGGLYWGTIKDYWKQVLLTLSSKCQTFVFAAHLKTVWAGNQPTSRQAPKGKDTLMELASLYLWLERKQTGTGKVRPVPSARVIKTRLAHLTGDGFQPLLPPRLDVATAATIRSYIENPPDYGKLKKTEKLEEEKFSEESRLEMKLRVAEAELAVAEATGDKPPTKTPREDTEGVKVATKTKAGAKTNPDAKKEEAQKKAHAKRLADLIALALSMGIDQKTLLAGARKYHEVFAFKDLTLVQIIDLTEKLRAKKATAKT